MTRPLRIGLVGAGRMGTTHAAFLAAEPTTVLAGVADPAVDALAKRYGVPAFRDHRQLIEAGVADALIIANPNDAHVQTARDSVDAGLPVLLEKPVATSMTEARALIDVVATRRGRVLVGHHRRHHPAVAQARHMVESGALGRLVAVNAMWLTHKAASYFDPEWRRQKGAGVLLINLVHDLDLLRHLCGEVTSVQARTGSAGRGYEVEDSAALILEFANGALGTLLGSDTALSPWTWDQSTRDDPTYPYHPMGSCYSLAGTSGALSFPAMAHFHQDGAADWRTPLQLAFSEVPPGDSYSQQLRHFVDVARGDAEPLVTVEDAAATLALVEAASASAATGKPTVPASIRAASGLTEPDPARRLSTREPAGDW